MYCLSFFHRIQTSRANSLTVARVWTNIVKNEHGSRLSEVTDCRQKDWDSFVNRDVGISLFTSSSFLSGPATDVVLYPAVIGDTFVVVCNIYLLVFLRRFCNGRE